MQGDFWPVRRAVAKLGAKSRGILERQLLTRLLSEPSALNVARCSLMTWSLLKSRDYEGKACWQVGSLDQQRLWHGICHCYASTGWYRAVTAHTQSSITFPARAKFLFLGETYVAAILARCQPTALRLLAAYLGQGIQWLSPKYNCPQNICRPGWDGHEQQGLRYRKLQGFQTLVGGYHRFGWRLYRIQWNNKRCFY